MKKLLATIMVLGLLGVALMITGAILTNGDWVGLLLVAGGMLIGACVPLLALLWAVENLDILEKIEKLDDKPRR